MSEFDLTTNIDKEELKKFQEEKSVEEKRNELVPLEESEETKEQESEQEEEIESEETEEDDEPKAEQNVVATPKVQKRPGYMYFVDKEGNVREVKMGRVKGKKIKKPFSRLRDDFGHLSLALPKVMLSSWISRNCVKISKGGGRKGQIYLPEECVGKKYKIILIPQEEWIMNYDK